MKEWFAGNIECFCDRCKHWTQKLYEWDGDELCEDCLDSDKEIDSIVCRCEECGDADTLYLYEGKRLCWSCFRDKLEVPDKDDVGSEPDPMDIARAWAEDHM